MLAMSTVNRVVQVVVANDGRAQPCCTGAVATARGWLHMADRSLHVLLCRLPASLLKTTAAAHLPSRDIVAWKRDPRSTAA